MIDSSANLETETRCRSTPKAHLALLPKVLHLGFLVTVKGGEWRFRFTVFALHQWPLRFRGLQKRWEFNVSQCRHLLAQADTLYFV